MEHNSDHKDTQSLEIKDKPAATRDTVDYGAFEDPSQSFICDSCQ